MRRSVPSQVVQSEQLLATVFHQLRTPISSINGYAAILLTGEMGRLTAGQREVVQRMQEICQALTTLTGNLLTLTKANTRRPYLSKEFVSLRQVALETTHSLQGEIRRKRLRFATRFPAKEVKFWADPGDMTQIFLNLLSNAVKFTPKEGRVELQVIRRPKELVIQVADNGVGIAKEHLSKIFREFYYVNHPEVGATLGSGLGLSIVKRIVDAYHGKIVVKSRLKRGSRFHLTFPILSEQKHVEGFFEETWFEARRSGWRTGLVLCQMKTSRRDGSGPPPEFSKGVQALERTLQDHVGKENRIFHLSADSFLVVLGRADPEGLPLIVHRLERALQEGQSVQGSKGQGIQWRLVALRAPRLGSSAARFLELAQRRLKAASWARAVPV